MHRSIICLVAAICCQLAIVVPSSAQRKPKPPAEAALPRGSDVTEGASQAEKAAEVFGEIMGSDNGISTDFLNKAECVAVFPSVIKAGFISGREGRTRGCELSYTIWLVSASVSRN